MVWKRGKKYANVDCGDDCCVRRLMVLAVWERVGGKYLRVRDRRLRSMPPPQPIVRPRAVSLPRYMQIFMCTRARARTYTCARRFRKKEIIRYGLLHVTVVPSGQYLRVFCITPDREERTKIINDDEFLDALRAHVHFAVYRKVIQGFKYIFVYTTF